jgi:hypothetical protein
MPVTISKGFSRFDIPGLVSWWTAWGQFIGLVLMVGIIVWLIFGLSQKSSKWPFIVAVVLLLFVIPTLLVRFAPQAFLSFAGTKEPQAFASFVDNKDGIKDATTRFGAVWLADDNLREGVRKLADPNADVTKLFANVNKDSLTAILNLEESTRLMTDPDRTALLKTLSDSLVWVQAATYLSWAVLLVAIILAFTPLFLKSKIDPDLEFAGANGYIPMPSPLPNMGGNYDPPPNPSVADSNFDNLEVSNRTQLDPNDNRNDSPNQSRPRVARTILDIAETKPLALLVIKEGSRRGSDFKLTEENEIGRDAERCNVLLDDGKVSSSHAKIKLEKSGWFIYDLASRNKTFVNNQEITKSVLKDGDRIKLGDTTLTFIEIDG